MTKIYYFSGTGNTLWSARKLSEIIDGECTLVNIGPEVEKPETLVEADVVVLVFPSYAFGLPLAVRRFAKKAVFKTPYLAAFVTHGSVPGGSLASIKRILKRKNIGSLYFGLIPAVENYIAIFGPPKEKTMRQRLEMQEEATEKAARCVIERHSNCINTFRPISAFIWLLFSIGIKLFYKRYRVSGDCNGCGACERVCSVSAISMRGGRPVFSSKCEHCQGCINWCPQKAIHFGRLNSGVTRYHHPEINLQDISR